MGRRPGTHLLSALPALAGLASCGGLEADLRAYAEARCALLDRCGHLSYLGVQSLEGCVEAMPRRPQHCPGMASRALGHCLEGLEHLSCEDFDAGLYPAPCLEFCPEDEL